MKGKSYLDAHMYGSSGVSVCVSKCKAKEKSLVKIENLCLEEPCDCTDLLGEEAGKSPRASLMKQNLSCDIFENT